MPVTKPRDLDEIARIGTDLIARCLPPADVDKCIAVDVHSGEYEVDDDDYAAVHRLHARVPDAEVWLGYADPSRMDRMGLR
jgi:hypothetical protein